MLSRGFSSEPTTAENGVIDEISRVLVGHLEFWRSRRRAGDSQASSPVLIQVDGPGRSLFLDTVAGMLDPQGCGTTATPAPEHGRWTVIRFDAWQFQRVAPPWWWLIKAIDRQLRARVLRFGGRRELWRWRLRDFRWRCSTLLGDIALAVPPILLAALVAGAAWTFSGKDEIAEILQWATTVIAALTAILGLGWSVANALRRHLLIASPAGAKAVLQTSDPMSELTERYGFLIRSSGTPVAILIDNLDRCRADYVVELLEGIQTLFKDEARDDALPMVLYVVAAARGWLCDSYLTVYDEFKDSVREPGRPFGQAFLDKVFNFSLRIPTVSAAISLSSERAAQHGLEAKAAGIVRARSELEVRRELTRLEREDAPAGVSPGPPNHALRRRAVRRLADLEQQSSARACPDTEEQLRELAAVVEPGPAIVRHLAAAYCVQRTVLLLAGHEIDDDPGAIERLGLWTILTLRWPLLTERLQRFPGDVERLGEGRAADGADAEIAALYSLPEARRFGGMAEAAGLDAAAVGRLTTPIDVRDVAGSPRLRFGRGGAPTTPESRPAVAHPGSGA
jgi:hypothetical protein